MANKKSSRQADTCTSHEVAKLVRQCLQEGSTVEIEGLGRFSMNRRGECSFRPETRPRVFIAYVVEDRLRAARLFQALRRAGFDPWMDSKKLLPGQNWPRAIERAIETSDAFIACLSRRSVEKPGMFQAELRYALDCDRRQPLGRIFLIPARLDHCNVPLEIQQQIQYVDLFPDWDAGIKRIIQVLNESKPYKEKRERLPEAA